MFKKLAIAVVLIGAALGVAHAGYKDLSTADQATVLPAQRIAMGTLGQVTQHRRQLVVCLVHGVELCRVRPLRILLGARLHRQHGVL
jgi:hypothetical protein